VSIFNAHNSRILSDGSLFAAPATPWQKLPVRSTPQSSFRRTPEIRLDFGGRSKGVVAFAGMPGRVC
jgi:hypothetical protein